MSLPAASALRRQVSLCLTRLSDRDTLPLAAAELESVARGLTREWLSTFVGCLDCEEEGAAAARVRRECVRVLGVVAHVHGESLSRHHVAKMINAVVRCLRDSDSALRAACVDCVSSMASKITKPPFSSFLNPLADAVFHEQDQNSQTGSALCLAAAIDASPNPEPTQLQKNLPKFLKLVTKDCFKAKAALLSLIGSICGAGGTANPNLLSGLVSCLLSFLGSKDWAARKAAGEAMARLAVAEREMLAEFRASVLASLENRRFDTVKIVRETMNNTLKLWKEVPEKVSPQSQCRSYSKEDGVVTRSPPLSGSSSSEKFETTQPKRNYSTNRSHSSKNLFVSTPPRKSPPLICDKKPNAALFSKMDHKECEVVSTDDLKNAVVGLTNTKTTNERNSILKLETRRALFRKNIDEKFRKSGSRVVPFCDSEYCDPDMDYDDKKDVAVNQKEIEDLNVIRKQLIQIENQQSNLLELLQRFMGSSQSGMNQLENRVNGLEKSLEEISQNLEASNARISNAESAENSCCRLPGADFLSPKFWKRAESQYSYSSFSLSQRNYSLPITRANSEMQKIDSPLQTNQVNIHGKLERSSSENVTINSDGEKMELFNTDGVQQTLPANRVASANRSYRSSTKDGS